MREKKEEKIDISKVLRLAEILEKTDDTLPIEERTQQALALIDKRGVKFYIHCKYDDYFVVSK